MRDEMKVEMPVMTIGELNKNLTIYDENIPKEWYKDNSLVKIDPSVHTSPNDNDPIEKTIKDFQRYKGVIPLYK